MPIAGHSEATEVILNSPNLTAPVIKMKVNIRQAVKKGLMCLKPKYSFKTWIKSSICLFRYSAYRRHSDSEVIHIIQIIKHVAFI